MSPLRDLYSLYQLQGEGDGLGAATLALCYQKIYLSQGHLTIISSASLRTTFVSAMWYKTDLAVLILGY